MSKGKRSEMFFSTYRLFFVSKLKAITKEKHFDSIHEKKRVVLTVFNLIKTTQCV